MRQAGGRLVVHGGPILVSATGGWLDGGHLIAEAGRVVTVGQGDPPAPHPDETRVDLDGRRLLPGLVDSHFHLVSRSSRSVDLELVASGLVEGVVTAVTRLAGGVTSVRDCGCRHHGIHQLRRAIDAGLVPGPRAAVAGRNPTSALAPDHWRNVVVDGPKEMAATVAAELAGGADFVKLILAHAEDPTDWAGVTSYLDDDELAAGVTAAHSAGARVGVHCEGRDEARRAIDAGVDVLDHAPLLDDRTVEAMAATGAVYVPTIWAFSADSGLDGPAAVAVRAWQEEHRRSVLRARAAGVTVAAGSDAAGSLPPADVLIDEMECLVAAGMSTEEVLAAATTGGAAAMGCIGRIGVIAEGAAADMVVVDGDPTVDLSVLRHPHLVVCRGRIHDPGRLREGWAEEIETVSALGASTSRWSHA